MVNGQLRPQGVTDPRLLEAFESISREAFVPPATRPIAYTDANLPLTQDPVLPRRLLAPLTLGKLLQLATIQPVDNVLVVGCGSGPHVVCGDGTPISTVAGARGYPRSRDG